MRKSFSSPSRSSRRSRSRAGRPPRCPCLAVSAPAAEREGFDKLVRSELARHKSHQMVDGAAERTSASTSSRPPGPGISPRRWTTRCPRGSPCATRPSSRRTSRRPSGSCSRTTQLPRRGHHAPQRPPALRPIGAAARPVDLPLRALRRHLARRARPDHAAGDRLSPRTRLGQLADRGPPLRCVLLRPGEHGDAALEVLAGVDGCLVHELYDKEFWTPYGAACAGVQYFQFVGREHTGAPTAARAHDVGIAPALRLGARFFRWHSFGFDLFAEGYLPVSAAQDIDGVLLSSKGLYTPSVQIGLGIGFSARPSALPRDSINRLAACFEDRERLPRADTFPSPGLKSRFKLEPPPVPPA